MQFLGSCEVCGKEVRNYRALGQHLRHNPDPEHQALKERWHSWRTQYRATLRCWKCGGLFEIHDKTEKDRKRCPRCQELRNRLSKRAYERLRFERPADPRRVDKASGSKARWPLGYEPQVMWEPGTDLYKYVVGSLRAGVLVNQILNEAGVSYVVYREIAEHAFGKQGYRKMMRARKVQTGTQNLKESHRWWDSLTPDEKAAVLKKRFGGTCQLEAAFGQQLRKAGFAALQMNVWQSVPIEGVLQPREADIKISVGDGRKVIVLCDGEAFHGPRVIYGDPAERIEADRQTALAYYSLGYTVLRYSETEIHTGEALGHFKVVWERLKSCSRLYRNWCPAEEQIA